MDQEKQKNQKKQQPTDPSKTKLRNYGKYSTVVFQMGITIALGVWGGVKIDEYFGLKNFPVFTLSLSLLSITASVYFVIKDLTKK